MYISPKKLLRITCFSIATIGAGAIVATVVAPDAAYAKSEKSKSKNNGKSGGKSGNGNGNSASDKSQKGGQGASSSKGGSGSDILLFLKKKTKPAKVNGKAAKKANVVVEGALPPQKLGKMNGAINSSPNAKLAHIRNGNFNGPVGLAAALAVADHNNAQYDQETLDAATDTLNLNQIATDLDAAAVVAGYADYASYLAENDPGTLDVDLEAAIEGEVLPTADEVAAAQTTLEDASMSAAAVSDAEAALLEAWNKGDATDPDASLVLDQIRGSLPSDEEVAAALASQETTTEASSEEDYNDEQEDDEEEDEDDELAQEGEDTSDVIVELIQE